MTQANPLVVQTPGITHDAVDFRRVWDVLFTEGILNVPAGQCLVSALTDGTLRVAVAAGMGVIKGDDVTNQGSYITQCTAAENVTVTAPPSTGNRLDLLVWEEIDADVVALAGRPSGTRFRAIPGTAVTTGSPVLPALPNTAIPLASFPVAAGQSTIPAASITDLRTQAGKASIGFARLDVQTFTASGTWTRPSGAAVHIVQGFGGGGPGAVSSGGASGGGGGEGVTRVIAAATVGATESVIVGAGGVTANAYGGNTTFGPHVVAQGGGPGGSGTSNPGIGGGQQLSVSGFFSYTDESGGYSDAGGFRAHTSMRGAGAGGPANNSTGVAGSANGVIRYPTVYSSSLGNPTPNSGGGGTAGSSTVAGGPGISRSGTGRAGDGGGGGLTGGAGGIPGGGGGAATSGGTIGPGARGELRIITLCL